MLSRPFAGKNDVVKKLKYREDDFLAPESVRAYIRRRKHTLRQCEVDDFGIDMPVFDKTIDQINTAANELASRLAEELGSVRCHWFLQTRGALGSEVRWNLRQAENHHSPRTAAGIENEGIRSHFHRSQ